MQVKGKKCGTFKKKKRVAKKSAAKRKKRKRKKAKELRLQLHAVGRCHGHVHGREQGEAPQGAQEGRQAHPPQEAEGLEDRRQLQESFPDR
jgi:hypothetical protein